MKNILEKKLKTLKLSTKITPSPYFKVVEAGKTYSEQPDARSRIFGIFYRMIGEIDQSNYKTQSSEVLERIDKAYSDSYITHWQQATLVDSLKSKVNGYALSHYRENEHSEGRKLMGIARQIARGN